MDLTTDSPLPTRVVSVPLAFLSRVDRFRMAWPDGSTTTVTRRELREEAHALLDNPHLAALPSIAATLGILATHGIRVTEGA